jgi:hypothetical protein
VVATDNHDSLPDKPPESIHDVIVSGFQQSALPAIRSGGGRRLAFRSRAIVDAESLVKWGRSDVRQYNGRIACWLKSAIMGFS